MSGFELRIRIQSDEVIVVDTNMLDAITGVLNQQHPQLKLHSVEILPGQDDDDDDLKERIEELTGRSKIIASFLYDNPGPHSTQEIKDVIQREQPFKGISILHSYLNNLISRRIVVKVSAGFYESRRVSTL